LLYCSRARVLKVQRGAYKLVKQCRTRESPTLSYVGGFSFYGSRWGPHYRYLALCLGTIGVRIFLVSRRGPLDRSGVGRLDLWRSPGQGVILAIFSGNAFPRCCPILAQSGRRDRSGGRLRSCPPEPTSLVRGAILRSSYHRTARPVRGVLPRTSRGCPVMLVDIITAGRMQRLWTPPPVVSRGLLERRCPLVRECSCPSPRRKIREAGVPGPARGLSWPACLSGGAVFLERTCRVTGMALTRGARSGGCHVSQEVGSLGSFA